LSHGKLEFENSKMTEAFLAESDFPKSIILGGQINNYQAQLVFGQLTTVYSKQGDTVRALEYQSRELEAHYNTLEWLENRLPYIRFDKINLWLNKWSNNFGRYWMRGVLFTFSSGFLLFLALMISTTEYKLGKASWNGQLLPAFLKFMNPIRFFDLDKLFDNSGEVISLTPTSYILDFLARVLIAYGFYQTIQAFRRFGRK
jgi:hypothetical protein